MRDVFDPAFRPAEPNPMKRAQASMARVVLPKRFYTDVAIIEGDAGFAIHLDGRLARTPGRNALALPNITAAEVIAGEWRAQANVIDPALMHATRMANTAIDSFAGRIAEVQADAAAYAASDLVCYRADAPDGLVALQARHWDPAIAFARDVLDARLILAEGIIHQAQPPEALARVNAAVARIDAPVRLAAFHVITTLTGSCLLALMATEDAMQPDAIWDAATVDENWNAQFWGMDEEAAERMARRRTEFMAAHALCRALA